MKKTGAVYSQEMKWRVSQCQGWREDWCNIGVGVEVVVWKLW